MPRSLIINSSNYVSGTNSYVYNFPSTVKFTEQDSVAVAGLSIYNNSFNITSSRGNNTLTLNFLGTNYIFTIPNGYYSGSDLNNFLQQQCILNGLYMTNSAGTQNIYFVEILVNSVQYAMQLNLYTVPTAANATTLGWVKPSSASWTTPGTNTTPTLTFNSAFGSLIGLSAGTYPTTAQSTNQNFLSSTAPIISPIDSYVLTCNLINCPYSVPNNILFAIPLTKSLGAMVTASQSTLVYNSVAPNVYSQIVIKLYDQSFQPLQINDYEFNLFLSILEAREKTISPSAK